jgi:hypothetical protein
VLRVVCTAFRLWFSLVTAFLKNDSHAETRRRGSFPCDSGRGKPEPRDPAMVSSSAHRTRPTTSSPASPCLPEK